MLRTLVVLALLVSALAPVAQAAVTAAERAAHACCPDRTPPPDAATPCNFSTAFTCCGPASVPSGSHHSLPAPAHLSCLAPQRAAPILVDLAPGDSLSALVRPPPQPPVRTTVLLL